MYLCGMKILALQTNKSGGQYHRLILPLSYLKADFTTRLDESLIKNYDSLWIHYKCDIHPTLLSMWRLKYGIQIVLDLDDTWLIDRDHPSYSTVKMAAELSKQFAIIADWVVCATPEIEKMVKPFNENTIIIPNRIPYGEGQFHVFDESLESFLNRKIRIGLCGSLSHINDWLSISGKLKRVLGDSQIKKECEFIVGGVPDFNKVGKPAWLPNKVEEIIKTKGYMDTPENRSKVEDYFFKEYLKQNREKWGKMIGVLSKPRIVLSSPVENYIETYREIDIMLCPLIDNDLNSKKSTLKILECACTNTLCILGEPYRGKGTECDYHLYENWYENIKGLIKNKEELWKKKLDISEKIRNLYSFDDVVQQRKQILGIKREVPLNIWGITYKEGQQTEYKEYRNTVNTIEEKSYLFENNVILNIFKNEILI